VRRTLRWNMRVMVFAEDVGGPVQGVMADPPTSLGVAVDLPDAGVYPDADGSDEGRFTEVGAEARPEVVVQVRPTVECAGVKRQPMSHNIKERNEEGNPKREEKGEKKAKSKSSRLTTLPGFWVGFCPTAGCRRGGSS